MLIRTIYLWCLSLENSSYNFMHFLRLFYLFKFSFMITWRLKLSWNLSLKDGIWFFCLIFSSWLISCRTQTNKQCEKGLISFYSNHIKLCQWSIRSIAASNVYTSLQSYWRNMSLGIHLLAKQERWISSFVILISNGPR